MNNLYQDFASVSPSDFHHLEAKLGLPLAPAFLPRPSRSRIYDPIKKSEDSDNDEADGELDNSPSVSKAAQACSNTTNASGGAIEAVNQMLATLLMKYVPNLGCVLLAYLSPPLFVFKDSSGREYTQKADCRTNLPFETVTGLGWASINIRAKFLGWRPTIGQKLIGKPTMSSPSHLSLILYQTFNASIPENHLIPAGYHYDPNLKVPASWQQNVKSTVNSQVKMNELTEATDEAQDLDQEYAERGCWVDPHGNIVGGEAGVMSFTAISLTITNNMISVTGSVLANPFSSPVSGSVHRRQTMNVRAQESSDSSDNENYDRSHDRSALPNLALSTTGVNGTPRTIHPLYNPQPIDSSRTSCTPKPKHNTSRLPTPAQIKPHRPSESQISSNNSTSIAPPNPNQLKRSAIDNPVDSTPKKKKKKKA
ncbi:hypothetical protein CROQUDRAFT_96370 [Cronartium quercuum f. sp. fusiforme G11]|uniref:RPA43 OB domain-containing protein n=1 Tax=Cronartium quercuum f. sp. fusiforme G11 TaxID=708437 RepID=A0A9P6NG22_9BASI|nr:hypothetical protein CROQUDRAFT_96370 [Cronartium quercuum f. sp. fusiforme G11]